jgi:hypothetical protein
MSKDLPIMTTGEEPNGLVEEEKDPLLEEERTLEDSSC